MNVIIIMLIVMISISPGIAFAHPDTLRAGLMNNDIPVDNVKFIGVETRNTPNEKDLELFSGPWFWHNFMLFLIVGIGLVMAISILTIYRDELPIKLIRKSQSLSHHHNNFP